MTNKRFCLSASRARLAVWTLCIGFILFAVSVFIYTLHIEPNWIRTHVLYLSDTPVLKVCHISDIHYDGNQARLEGIIQIINDLEPDFVCFTGDIVDDTTLLDEVLQILCNINCPVFGTPGNHDYAHLSRVYRQAFESTGGAWLSDEATSYMDTAILGIQSPSSQIPEHIHATQRILLCHYPEVVDHLHGSTFDLILAGHSHGGQVRIPGLGAFIVPYQTGRYDRGLFHTAAGPLYVNPGLGTWFLPLRLFCRPEITLIYL